MKERFKFSDPDGRTWAEQNLSSPNPRPNLTYPFTAKNGITYEPPKNGWKCSPDRMQKLDDEGRLHYPAKRDGRLRLKSYQDELPGVPVQDVWVDVGPIGGTSPERLGYPTQKPEALLERIIRTSSNAGDIVLDPFCGCGTAVSVAQRLGRRWIGIDITHLAISLIKARLRDTYGLAISQSYKTIREPVSIYDAANLAGEDRYQFQFWALGLVGARPTPEDQKKGADRGIDGRLRFHDDESNGKTKQIIISVKSGKVDVAQVRDLRGVIERENAEIGVFITLNESTAPMRTEAVSAGFYASPWGTKHPRLQILTVAELLDGRTIDMPPSRDLRSFKKAPKAKGMRGPDPMLPFE